MKSYSSNFKVHNTLNKVINHIHNEIDVGTIINIL